MQSSLIHNEIIDINRRFANLCLRASEDQLPEVSTLLNTSMQVLRAFRSLSSDQIESVIASPRLLLQPALSDRSILKAAAIKSHPVRALFMSGSTEVVRHA
jgi:hypothetical protein